MYYPIYDPTMILLIPALILTLWAQLRVKWTFSKYSKVTSERKVSAEEVAEMLLYRNGLSNIRIEHIAGELTDHYDPRSKVLRLSTSVNGSRSIAAIGVAAHEVGHAIQDKEGYGFLRLRNAVVPVVQLCSMASMPLFFIGLLLGSLNLLDIGIFLFCGVLVFHLITLPVEFDASARALKMLRNTNTLSPLELQKARSVLSAAALTYVAAMVMALLQLIRLLVLRDMRRR